MADTTYRSWLQTQANSGNNVADALLQVVGDDGRVNDTFRTSGSFLGYGDPSNGGYRYDVDTILNENQEYYDRFTGGPARVTGGNTVQSGGGTSGLSAQDRDYLNSQINQINWGIGQLDPQLQVAKENIGNQYNAAFNKLQGGFNTAQGQLQEQKDQVGQDYLKAGSNIDVSVGAGNRSLKRLLGRFGAGSSSAAKVLAPYAAGKQGARQRGEVADQYAENNAMLDQNWNQFKTNYDQELAGLSDWKRNQESQAMSDVNSRRASFLQQLGGIQAQLTGSVAAANPYISQAQGLLSGLTELGRQYNTAANVRAPTYQRADTSPYEFSRAGAPTLGENVAIQDAVNPYASLFGKKDDKKLKVSY